MEEDGVIQSRVSVAVSHVDRCTVLQHVANDLYVTFARGDVQRRPTVVVAQTEVGPLQQGHRVFVANSCGSAVLDHIVLKQFCILHWNCYCTLLAMPRYIKSVNENCFIRYIPMYFFYKFESHAKCF